MDSCARSPIDVAADDIEFSVRLGKVERSLARACCQTDLSKQLHFLRIKSGAADRARTALRDHGRLNRNRARAAERVGGTGRVRASAPGWTIAAASVHGAAPRCCWRGSRACADRHPRYRRGTARLRRA